MGLAGCHCCAGVGGQSCSQGSGASLGGETEAGCCAGAVRALAEHPSHPIASPSLTGPASLPPLPPTASCCRKDVVQSVQWRTSLGQDTVGTKSLQSNRADSQLPCTHIPPAAGKCKGLLEAKSPLAPFWGLSIVPSLVTLSPTSVSSHNQHSPYAPAQRSPLLLLVPLMPDSNPVLWPRGFPPPISDATRGQSNKMPSTMSQQDGTFQAHRNWSRSPTKEPSL